MANNAPFVQKNVRSGFQVSHSHIRTKKNGRPTCNVKADLDGHCQGIRVCTPCLKSGR